MGAGLPRGRRWTQVSVGGFQSDGEAAVYGLDNGAVDVLHEGEKLLRAVRHHGQCVGVDRTTVCAQLLRGGPDTIRRARRRGGIGWCAGVVV